MAYFVARRLQWHHRRAVGCGFSWPMLRAQGKASHGSVGIPATCHSWGSCGQEDHSRSDNVEEKQMARANPNKTSDSLFLLSRKGDFLAMKGLTRLTGRWEDKRIFYFYFLSPEQNLHFLLMLQKSSCECEIPLYLLLIVFVVVFCQAKSPLHC